MTGKAQTANTLKDAHPRIWLKATKDQRRQIVERYEETGDVGKAFAGVRAFRVTDADLQWFGQRVGGGR